MVAASAGEDGTAIEDRDPPPAPAGRTQEPRPASPKPTGRVVEKDGIFLVLPFSLAAAMAIGEDHAVGLCAHPDRCDLLALAQPSPAAPTLRRKGVANAVARLAG